MAEDGQKSDKILVVEDDEASSTILVRFLNLMGYSNISLAENGKEAINELNIGQVDLIISDWHMPDMDGLEFYWTAKNEGLIGDAPFLMVSAENDRARIIEALKAGVNDYILKPVDSKILKEKIEKLLGSSC
ncbi:MAG: response regulator [Nitrospinae bacterium]|nr:response regulator [Nitrospinota bacterium]MBL7020596.1 response regulator [Nitrospinaceae bacterium]